MSNLKYNRGAQLERDLVKLLLSQGIDAWRCAGSKGFGRVDVIALVDGKPVFYQAKTNGYCTPAERHELQELAKKHNGIARICYRDRGVKFKEVDDGQK